MENTHLNISQFIDYFKVSYNIFDIYLTKKLTFLWISKCLLKIFSLYERPCVYQNVMTSYKLNNVFGESAQIRDFANNHLISNTTMAVNAVMDRVVNFEKSQNHGIWLVNIRILSLIYHAVLKIKGNISFKPKIRDLIYVSSNTWRVVMENMS